METCENMKMMKGITDVLQGTSLSNSQSHSMETLLLVLLS